MRSEAAGGKLPPCWLKEGGSVAGQGKVSPADLDLLSVADDPDDVVRTIQAAHQNGGPLGPAVPSADPPGF